MARLGTTRAHRWIRAATARRLARPERQAARKLAQIGPYVGHSSTYMTERYQHLVKGHEDRTRDQFDEYLARANTADRIRQLGEPTTTKGA